MTWQYFLSSQNFKPNGYAVAKGDKKCCAGNWFLTAVYKKNVHKGENQWHDSTFYHPPTQKNITWIFI